MSWYMKFDKLDPWLMKDTKKSSFLGSAVGLVKLDSKHSRTIAFLLQEDETEAPISNGESHTGNIDATLEKRQKDLKDEKTQLDQIEGCEDNRRERQEQC
jgi:hypothetical protein